MYPEDRVLVGVINRKRDLEYARQDGWYRIPQLQKDTVHKDEDKDKGVHAEYLAFFLSNAFQERNGGVHYFAERKGCELLKRKDLLPNEPHHKNAEKLYFKVQLGPLRDKIPPILNPSRRSIAFIYTTWDRFVHAHEIKDLYSKEDYYVNRIFHALRNKGVAPERTWSAEYGNSAPQIRIICQSGPVTGSTDANAGDIHLDPSRPDDEILNRILLNIAKQGGPVFLHIPADGI